MVQLNPAVLLVLALLATTACSEPGSPADAGGEAADASVQRVDAGPSADAGIQALSINATSVRLAQHPTNGDSVANGAIGVVRDGAFVSTATVTVNGAAVPLHSTILGGFYDLSQATVPNLTPGAGSPVEIVAVDGSDRAELVLACPGAMTFTSPVEGAALSVGDFTATWTGKLDYNSGATQSQISVFPYDAAAATTGQFVDETNTFRYLDGAATSAQLHNPGGSLPGYLLEMQVDGVAVQGPGGSGKCRTQFRIALSKP
ncbi:MAG TPA: hypothetical protein VGK67_19995 [Myxococcales bacterium]|jgi:hypothetical protein